MRVQVSCSVPGSSFDLLTWFLARVRLNFYLMRDDLIDNIKSILSDYY